MSIALKDLPAAVETYLETLVTCTVSPIVPDVPNTMTVNERGRFSITVTNAAAPDGVRLTNIKHHVSIEPINRGMLVVPASTGFLKGWRWMRFELSFTKTTTGPGAGAVIIDDANQVNGTALTKVAETKVGHWCQGAAFSKDNKTVVIQCMVEKNLQAFNFDGRNLKPAGTVPLGGGGAGLRTAAK